MNSRYKIIHSIYTCYWCIFRVARCQTGSKACTENIYTWVSKVATFRLGYQIHHHYEIYYKFQSKICLKMLRCEHILNKIKRQYSIQKIRIWWGSNSGIMLANPHAYPLGHSDCLLSTGVWNNIFACSCILYTWESPSIFSFVIVLTSLPDIVRRTVIVIM